MPSPTERALAELRRRGYTAQVVERFNMHAKLRQDLFGFADVLGLGDGEIVAIQATGGEGGNHAARRAKLTSSPGCLAWLKAGGRVLLWSWALRGARGARKLYEHREEEILLRDIDLEAVAWTIAEAEARKQETRAERAAKRAQARLRSGPPTIASDP